MKHVYLWSTVIGAILGGIPAMYYVDDIWRMKPIQGGFEFMRWVGTVIVLLAVPVGAMCGAALAALLHFMVELVHITIWCIAIIGKGLQTLKGHTSWVMSVAFSPDGQRIVSGSEDWTAKIWDANSGQELKTLKIWDANKQTLRGHTAEVQSVAFSPDGQRMVSCSNDKTVKIWDASE